MQDIQATTCGKRKNEKPISMPRTPIEYKLLQDIQATTCGRRKNEIPILMPITPIEYKLLQDIQATTCGKRKTHFNGVWLLRPFPRPFLHMFFFF